MANPTRPSIAVIHGDLVIDIPATWIDQSTLAFVAPTTPAAPGADGKDGRSAGPATVEGVTVRFVRLPPGGVVAVLAAERRQQAANDPDLKVLLEEPLTTTLGAGHLIAWKTTPIDVKLVRMAVAVAHGDACVLAIATTTADAFAGARSRLLDILGSLRRRA
jgi:hypothetical protein